MGPNEKWEKKRFTIQPEFQMEKIGIGHKGGWEGGERMNVRERERERKREREKEREREIFILKKDIWRGL